MCLRINDLQSRGDWIRTSDLLLPKQALYRAKLRPEFHAARLREAKRIITSTKSLNKLIASPRSESGVVRPLAEYAERREVVERALARKPKRSALRVG